MPTPSRLLVLAPLAGALALALPATTRAAPKTFRVGTVAEPASPGLARDRAALRVRRQLPRPGPVPHHLARPGRVADARAVLRRHFPLPIQPHLCGQVGALGLSEDATARVTRALPATTPRCVLDSGEHAGRAFRLVRRATTDGRIHIDALWAGIPPEHLLAAGRRIARVAGRSGAAAGGTRADHDRATLIDAHDAQLAPLDAELRAYARRQPGCRALMGHNGIGPPTSVTILAELGDARRRSSSREAVRYSGLDITVH